MRQSTFNLVLEEVSVIEALQTILGIIMLKALKILS